MAYYKLTMRQLPRIEFAHGYQTDRYSLRFWPIEDFFEITYLEQGDICWHMADGRAIQYEAPGILSFLHREEVYADSDQPVHRHSTVGVCVPYDVEELTAEQVVAYSRSGYQPEGNCMFSAILTDFSKMEEHNSHIEETIRTIIRLHTAPGAAHNIRCSGLLMTLLADLTEDCIRTALLYVDTDQSLGSIVYSRRAIRYIANHIDSKISVVEIAEELGISTGYLSRMFRKATGQTLVEYINRVKLERVKELLANQRLTLREAGEYVGITDENYLSRLFKKYTGLTVQEYKALLMSF